MRVTVVESPPQGVRSFPSVEAENLTLQDVETIREIFHTPLTGSFNWDYDSANAKIRRLYELGKAHNWNTTVDVDWDAECDLNDFPSDPELSALKGFPQYEALSHEDKVRFAWKAHAREQDSGTSRSWSPSSSSRPCGTRSRAGSPSSSSCSGRSAAWRGT